MQRAVNSDSDLAKLDPLKARIKKYFHNRTLHTLPHPADLDERDMHKLKSLHMQDFNPDFISNLDKLFQHIVKNVNVKSWKGTRFTGKIIALLVNNLVTSINNDSMLELDFAWMQMLKHEYNQLCNKYNAMVKEKIDAKRQNMPYSTELAYKEIDGIYDIQLKAIEDSKSLNNADMTIKISSEIQKTLSKE